MAKPQKKKTIPPLRQQDPFLEREKQRYPSPIPSREFILQVLAEQGVPLFPDELAHLLSINASEQLYFERRLVAMEREGQVIINRKGAVCAAQKLDLVKCRIIGHRDGFGFAVPEEYDDEKPAKDLFLPEREMKKVLHGDHVMVRIVGQDYRGRPEGRIVEVLSHNIQRLVGRIQCVRGVCVVQPEDRRISQDILIEPGSELGAKDGQVVLVEIVQYPDRYVQPVGRVIEVLGNYADPGMEIEIALRKYDLPFQFSDEAQKLARKTPKKVRKKDLAPDRVDLRALPLVTIDGETARDFDDAVYAEKQGKGFRLIVAIADVSFYVEPDQALDQEAYLRGTSVYFPRRVIPMLPEALSNGICSLNPNVDRLCMVCDMHISPKGAVKRYLFYPAVMQSKARLTYDQVWDWLSGEGDYPFQDTLQNLYALFNVLQEAREKRGAIEFDSIETAMLFNDEGKIDKIVPVVRNDAHKLIEECMLLANVCAADLLQKHHQKILFRVHEGPTKNKLEALRHYLRLVGLMLEGGDKPTAKDYAKLARQISGRPDADVLQAMLLRSMQQAVYTPENEGHFGLAYEAYVHFTSPIRRYPDLLVHRAIRALLKGKKYKPSKKWIQLGEQCSMTERRAEDASREVEAWLKTYYMQDKIGESFSGKISAVTSFGVFVLLDDLYVEGLVHVAELGKDYFHFKREEQIMLGEKSGVRYGLGDRLKVKVISANLESNQIDFALCHKEVAVEKKNPPDTESVVVPGLPPREETGTPSKKRRRSPVQRKVPPSAEPKRRQPRTKKAENKAKTDVKEPKRVDDGLI